MVRLTRRAEYSAADAFYGILEGVADNGREVLKALERLKYQVTQCANAVQDEDVSKRIVQNASILDRAMSAVYGVCFDLENLGAVPVYEDDQVQLNGEYGYDLGEEVPADEPAEDEEPADTGDNAEPSTDVDTGAPGEGQAPAAGEEAEPAPEATEEEEEE